MRRNRWNQIFCASVRIGVALAMVVMWGVIGSAKVWAASKHEFPLIKGHQLLRHKSLPPSSDIEFLYLYGSLGFIEADATSQQRPEIHLSTNHHKNVIPLYKHHPFHDVDVYLQAEFIDYTIPGLLENFVFDEIDDIVFENSWNLALREYKEAQEVLSISSTFEQQGKYSDGLFSEYKENKDFSLAQILSPDMLSEFQSIVSGDNRLKNENLNTQKRGYDLANDKQVKVKYALKNKKSDPIKESEKYARANPRSSGLEFYKRDGIVVRSLAWVSGTLKYFYDHKIQGVLVALVCMGVYLFFNAVVLRKYAVKS